MCQPSASSAIELNHQPATTSTTIVTAVSSATARVRRSADAGVDPAGATADIGRLACCEYRSRFGYARPPFSETPMQIAGRCHCGNLSFELTLDPDPAEIAARACTCSFCVKHGGLWTSS